MSDGCVVVLVFLSGPRDGESVPLPSGGHVVLGREARTAHVVVDDPDVSRRHAILTAREGAWWLEDVGSRNGTFVGEFAASRRIVAPERLPSGAVFRIGNTRLRLGAAGGDMRTAARHAAAAPSE